MLTVKELQNFLDCVDDDTTIGIGYKHKGTLHFHDSVTFDIRIVRKGDRVEELFYFIKHSDDKTFDKV